MKMNAEALAQYEATGHHRMANIEKRNTGKGGTTTNLRLEFLAFFLSRCQQGNMVVRTGIRKVGRCLVSKECLGQRNK
jgi:hypothetical protein